MLGADEALLALVIAPIATELPEKFNSVLWVRQRKDTLAMGNITGAMVFQSTIPTVVGLVFASAHWVVTERLAPLVRVGRHRVRRVCRDLPADGGSAAGSTGAACSSAASFYLGYIGLVIARLTSSPAV